MINPTDCYIKAQDIKTLEKNYLDLQKSNGNAITIAALKVQLDGLKSEYNSSGCGVDIIMDRCLFINKQIEILTQEVAYYSKQVLLNGSLQGKLNQLNYDLSYLKQEHKGLNCVAKVEESRQKVVSSIINTYTNVDQTRIETQSKAEVKKRTIFAGIILLVSLGLVIKFSIKK